MIFLANSASQVRKASSAAQKSLRRTKIFEMFKANTSIDLYMIGILVISRFQGKMNVYVKEKYRITFWKKIPKL